MTNMEFPELSRLSAAQKDELIHANALFFQIHMLAAKVAELEGQLALNSRNSSKSPSSESLIKRNYSGSKFVKTTS